jgi:DHA2 family methylenomycin A resistance protein-like MFS transporter
MAMDQAIRADRSSRLRKSLTLGAMALGYCVVQLDVTIVNTAINSMAASLSGGVSELQWVVTAYTIAFAALILTAGALGDRIGAKGVFMAGFAVFTLASLGCALAPTAGILIAARALQGMGAAILVPNSLALLNHAYPDPVERGRAVGIWLAGASVALAAGPPIGGALITFVGWRSIFLVNVPVGIIGLVLAWRFARDTPRHSHALDLPGQVGAIASLGLLAGALIEGGRLGWTNPFVLASFGAAIVVAALFILQERREAEPMLPLSLFEERFFAVTTTAGLFLNIPFYGLIFVFSLYFQRVNGLSPLATGMAFIPMLSAFLPVNLISPRLAERYGQKPIIIAGTLIIAISCAGLLGISRGTPYWAMCAQLTGLAAGLGTAMPPLTSAHLGSVDRSRSGLAAGVLNSARQSGSVIGVALFGSLIGQSADFISGVHASLLISIALLIAIAAMVALGAPKTSVHR